MFWDQTGLVLMTKRLEDGKFRWPAVQDGVMRLSPAQLSALLEGLDWSRVHARAVSPGPQRRSDPHAIAKRPWRAFCKSAILDE
jgi:transposase